MQGTGPSLASRLHLVPHSSRRSFAPTSYPSRSLTSKTAHTHYHPFSFFFTTIFTMHAFTSVAALCSAAVMMATSASASTLSSVPPSHLRFRRAVVSVTPTSPGPGETFNEGAQCTTEWTPGQGNNWKSMTISRTSCLSSALMKWLDSLFSLLQS